MKRQSNLIMAVVAGASAIAATSASAATFIVDATTNQPVPLPGAKYVTFDGTTLGNTTQTDNGVTVAFTGGGAFVQGSLGNIYAAPTLSSGNGAKFGGQADGPDATTYVTSGIGSATLTFATPTNYLGFLWGSIDTYNSLTLYTTDGGIQTFTGSQIGSPGSSKYVNFTASAFLVKAVFTSTANAFEFDNVAVGSVPEPASWALMLVGFGAVGFGMRYRREREARVSYAF